MKIRRGDLAAVVIAGVAMAGAIQLKMMQPASGAVLTAATQPAGASTSQVAVTFSGGYDTDGRDRGRPVVLIAAALGVPSDVFREAFTHVKPAGPGQQPEPNQVRQNKAALMKALGPYGITDDRLNEVSNYYRYNRSRGEMWKTTPATASATVSNGKVTGITITSAGSGYSSPPSVSIAGMPELKLTAKLAFGKEFTKNGSVQEIVIGDAGPTTRP